MTAFAAFRLPLLADAADRASVRVSATVETAPRPSSEQSSTIAPDDWVAVIAERIVGGRPDGSDSSDAVKNEPDSPDEWHSSPIESVKTPVMPAAFSVVPLRIRLLAIAERRRPSVDETTPLAFSGGSLDSRAPPVRPVV
jgi:hypothetical protein